MTKISAQLFDSLKQGPGRPCLPAQIASFADIYFKKKLLNSVSEPVKLWVHAARPYPFQ